MQMIYMHVYMYLLNASSKGERVPVKHMKSKEFVEAPEDDDVFLN